MRELFNSLVASTGIEPQFLMLFGIAFGILIFVLGASGVFAGPRPELDRMRRGSANGGRGALDVVSRGDTNPSGIFTFFVPASQEERATIRKRLRQAGLHRPSALRNYYLIRTMLGFALPAAFVGLLFVHPQIPLPESLALFLAEIDMRKALFILTGLLVVGFYGPALWLRSKIEERRKQIEYGMPGALDLLQVAVEAGMGFDSAMNRVAHEVVGVCRPIAEEFMTVQLEMQAGMERADAFLRMADRCGVEEMSSFANVILQSAQFGTSISSALQTYADEMRVTRELNAQERANKLPVKMSAVMAAIMMPTLLMLTLTPVAIRWMRAFSEF